MRRWLPRETGVAAGWAIIALCLLAFGFLVDNVFEDDLKDFDSAVLTFFRQAGDPARTIGPRWLEAAFRDITSLGSATVLTIVTAASCAFLLMIGKRLVLGFMLTAIVGGMAINQGLKHLFQRPRPDLVTHLTDFSGHSFPSGHTIMAAIVYLTLGAVLCQTVRDHRLRAYVLGLAIAMALLVGFSRVFLGVHWPTDVLAGWCVGAAWAIACWLATIWIQRRLEPRVGE